MTPLLRLAWRELRGAPAAALLALLCIAAGVAGRAAVGTVSDAVDAAMRREGRALLGGDLEIAANRAPRPEEDAAIAAALPAGSRTTTVRALTTMASNGRLARLVELRAVDPAFPLAGSVTTAPGAGLERLHGDQPLVLVEEDLLRRLEVAVGARLRLGALEATIAGTMAEDAAVSGSPFRLGPRVWLGQRHLEATGLGGFGARIRHGRLALLPGGADPEAVAERLRAGLGLEPHPGDDDQGPAADRFSVRTTANAAQQTRRLAERVADWMRLTALLALALAAVGVAAVVRARLHARLDTLAVLRVCGATPGMVAGVFLLQAAGLGLAGGLLGALLGTAAANLLLAAGAVPGAGGGWPCWSPLAAATGLAAGLGAALIAAAVPVLEAVRLPPLAVLRGESVGGPRPAAAWAALAAGLAALALLAALDARSWLLGPLLVAVGAVCWLLLALGARVLLPLLAGLRWPGVAARLAARNLVRPGLRPGAAVAAVGMAGVLVGTLLAYRSALLSELGDGRATPLPSLFVIDLQADQAEPFRTLMRELGGGEATLAPLVRGRWRSAAGERPPTSEREAEQARFLRQREQNLSFREQLGGDETVVAGRWMDPAGTRVEASLEERFARRVGVGLGARIRLDIQGEEVEAEVTSLRRVRWTSFRPNFFILLSPAALRDLPQTWVASVPALDRGRRDRLESALAERFPNASAIEVGTVAERVLALVDQAAWVVRALAALALGAGLLAVAGVAVATARARRADTALLRALGGGRATAAAVLGLEFALLGGTGAALGLGLAIATGGLLTGHFLGVVAPVPWIALALAWLVITACATAAGLMACLDALRVAPLEALRSE